MKTFEMMKLAEKTGKTYKFRSLCYSTVNGFVGDTSGEPYKTEAFSYLNELLEIDDWEEVKQPVTWQEALEAWANGKSLKLIINGKSHYLPPNNFAIAREDIKEGEWFINE